jgi:predicted metalloprotease
MTKIKSHDARMIDDRRGQSSGSSSGRSGGGLGGGMKASGGMIGVLLLLLLLSLRWRGTRARPVRDQSDGATGWRK